MIRVEVLEERFERPAAFDPPPQLPQSLAAKPGRWPTEVLLHTTLDDAKFHISGAFAWLEETADGVVLRANFGNLRWMARFLGSLNGSFVVRQPAELREELRRHAADIVRLAGVE